ncbi:MAG: T9SS type A sorting domain-containing protein [Candidatus Eisenbacteria bacterium]
MKTPSPRSIPFPATLVLLVIVVSPAAAFAGTAHGPEETISAGGVEIAVPGYSVPSFAFWDGDALPDLLVGEGGGAYPDGKVRVYPNVGTLSEPLFDGWFYVQSDGEDLICPGSGCMGCFPRVVHWDGDGKKDLVIGRSDGTVWIYKNIGTDPSPTFDGGTPIRVGEPGSEVNIDVGNRATPIVTDWNLDGKQDLVVGAYDGKIHLFLNEGEDTLPVFRIETFAIEDGLDLLVPTARSSPEFADWDGDGVRDLLTGNTEGQILVYSNVGTDDAPLFSGYIFEESGGSSIDLAGSARSRPFVCAWGEDDYLDLLVGAGDGKVRLYEGVSDTGLPGGGESAPPAVRTLLACPNPFNPSTELRFFAPGDGRVTVTVHDLRGREIAVLFDAPGDGERHAIIWNAGDLPSGVYLVRVGSGAASETVKTVLVR